MSEHTADDAREPSLSASQNTRVDPAHGVRGKDNPEPSSGSHCPLAAQTAAVVPEAEGGNAIRSLDNASIDQ